ncbi:MAG: nickel-dependent hydrogenase large subunit [Lamprobacter sp.]|uniref:nickel-dependent hydrogenase large subunit n=1 Tax=Lamprobacter sp. TaxID=3100796 RepID=UPI002B25ED17|nr:nickel-dependent hydrogenase large subunit [Lamprobacter sp.]MEA3643679.1 nickel-dependent hydrogenase large subunit [Lamprobacter sp.]
MSDLAGQLEISLDQGRGAVAIGSSRPVTAARVFAGKSPAEVVRQLPMLYSLCGTAQAAACVGACEQALGRQPSAAVLARRQALVDAETIKEHLWRLLLDWPKMLEIKTGSKANTNTNTRASSFTAPVPASVAASAMPRVMRAYMKLRQDQRAAADPFTLDMHQAERGAAAAIDPSSLLHLVAEQALGTLSDHWLMTVDSPEALQRWLQEAETPAAELVRTLLQQGLTGMGASPIAWLPESPWRQLAQALASAEADAFIAAPLWQQQCAETGPLARVAAQPLIAALLAEYGNGLLTRLVGLLVDLAQSASRLEARLRATMEGAVEVSSGSMEAVASGISTGAGIGVGRVEAARGLLLHRVSLADGRVQQYQILAPTEWNFHPQGVVAQGLAAIARGGTKGVELERLARLYITAVDPCVDYQLSVS